ncbi:MAG: MFS transporter [Candidatus Pacebacteria bacterium]|nr:MFS transporter [Candidatus Paceibacterota bacterium]
MVKILRGPFAFVTATMFLNFAWLSIIIPVIPYIVQHYTTNIALYVGLISSVAAFCQFLVSPFLGYLSDKFGRRPVVLLSLLGGAVGYVMFGLGGALWVLFLSRIIDGLSSGDTPAMYAYIADVLPPHERGRYYGILGAAAGLGFMAGPAIGGLAAQISLSAPFYVAAALAVANALWGSLVMPESLKDVDRVHGWKWQHINPFTQFRSILTSFTLRVLFAASLIFFIGLVMQQSNFSVFLKEIMHWGPTQIGIMLTVVGLVDFFAEGYLSGKLLSVLEDMLVVGIGVTLTAVGMFLVGTVALTASEVALYIGIIIYTLGDGLFEPAMTGLVSMAAGPHEQGRVQGGFQSIQSIARVIAPLCAGYLYEMAAYLPYFSSMVLMGITLVILTYFSSKLVFERA